MRRRRGGDSCLLESLVLRLSSKKRATLNGVISHGCEACNKLKLSAAPVTQSCITGEEPCRHPTMMCNIWPHTVEKTYAVVSM
jgi:hypothetical protein